MRPFLDEPPVFEHQDAVGQAARAEAMEDEAAPYTVRMYTLWDLESGNLTEEFPTLAAALAAIRDDVVELGRQDAEACVLFQETTDQPRVIAEGADLVNLALRSELVHPSTSAS